MPEGSHPTGIRLRVRSLDAMESFYVDLLGLAPLDRTSHRLVLSPPGEGLELILETDPDAPDRARGTAGLFHLAIRVPDRPSLAAVLTRLADRQASIEGASDHGVSEAVYLSDPEGNGIEIYRDRPREAWPTRGDEVAMVTEPLDVEGLLAETEQAAPLPAGTDLGHVHLSVSSLADSGSFYQDLGLRVRQSTYPGALFLAAGDYHHHVGLNTWGNPQPRDPASLGLVGFTLGIPDHAWSTWRSGLEIDPTQAGGQGLVLEDPIGVQVTVQPT